MHGFVLCGISFDFVRDSIEMFDSYLVFDIRLYEFELFWIEGRDGIEDTMKLQGEALRDDLFTMFFVGGETLDNTCFCGLDICFQGVHYINYLMGYVDQ